MQLVGQRHREQVERLVEQAARGRGIHLLIVRLTLRAKS